KETAADRKSALKRRRVRALTTKQDRSLEKSKHFNRYFQTVRDKIRKQLKRNYTGFSEEGEVRLMFTLISDGSMDQYMIDQPRSTDDKLLLEVAELSLIDSAPFPKFPGGLKKNRITFNVVVSFKR
ncbi:hypothetical protein ACFL42_05270, partial [Candidatus Omnitrophota bacterium]